ncbi:unnamed protein product [Rangifer tarandus platyrhynchus]|uniref:Secreted protein n=2 Tax=Rangifer tarandus platyrhynchus TaxID=3082113 RepID=A0ABN8YUF9_RANTA|nr:unnamed protein product [Rangifer tarandus platyrhynchus]CAI9701796.1 unnamed protein product [Rangifer tarandus platyrhynchus]
MNPLKHRLGRVYVGALLLATFSSTDCISHSPQHRHSDKLPALLCVPGRPPPLESARFARGAQPGATPQLS